MMMACQCSTPECAVVLVTTGYWVIATSIGHLLLQTGSLPAVQLNKSTVEIYHIFKEHAPNGLACPGKGTTVTGTPTLQHSSLLLRLHFFLGVNPTLLILGQWTTPAGAPPVFNPFACNGWPVVELVSWMVWYPVISDHGVREMHCTHAP